MEETRVIPLARIAAAAAAGRREVLPRLYADARAGGVAAADLQEATLQVFLFAGFPRAIGAFDALHAAFGDDPPPAPPREPEDVDLARGEEVFRRVYGPHAATVKAMLEALHPDFARCVLRDAYGRVLGRPFLALPEREVLAVAMLAALGQRRQLRAHVRGALRVGVPAPVVRAALDAAEEGAGTELPAARAIVERALAR